MQQTLNRPNYFLHFVNGDVLKLEDLTAGSVALDGAVQGPVMGDDLDRWSFDHHANCCRLITSATCEQIYRALVQGFDFHNRNVYVNDLDGDTLLSLWLIEHPEEVRDSKTVQRLVRAVGAVDAHGPAGKLELDADERALVDSFFSPDGMYGVLPRDVQQHFEEWDTMFFDAMQCISVIVDGVLVAKPAPTPDMKVLFENGTKIMVKSTGFGAFEPLYRQGYEVVIVTDGEGGYTVGKKSDLVAYKLGPHNVEGTLLHRLASLEPGWGGGSSIGGSPRPDGSKLTPAEVWDNA